jgi:hypothetical protein
MKDNKWLRLLTYVTGLVNQELLLQNEDLAAENRVLRAHMPAQLRLSDPERSALAEIGKRLGRKALAQVACVASQPPSRMVRKLDLHGDAMVRYCGSAVAIMGFEYAESARPIPFFADRCFGVDEPPPTAGY